MRSDRSTPSCATGWQSLAAAAGIVLVATTGLADPQDTRFSGFIYFERADRTLAPPPFTHEDLSGNLKVNLRDYDFEERVLGIIPPGRIMLDTDNDGTSNERITYAFTVPDRHDAFQVDIDLDFGRFGISRPAEPLPFLRHVGLYPTNIYVIERYRSAREQRAVIDAFLADPETAASDTAEILSATFALLADAPRIEHFQLLVEYFRARLETEGRISFDEAMRIATLDAASTSPFRALSPIEQMRVLGDLGRIFAAAPHPEQFIYADFTYVDLTQQFFDTAMALAAAEARKGVSAIDFSYIARTIQWKYSFECSLPQRRGDCFHTIADAVALPISFDRKTVQAKFKAFATELELVSDYGKRDPTRPAFVARMQADFDRLDDWALFAQAACGTADVHTKVRASRRLAAVLDLALEIAPMPCPAPAQIEEAALRP